MKALLGALTVLGAAYASERIEEERRAKGEASPPKRPAKGRGRG